MADNFLERQRRDYEENKKIWLKKKCGVKTVASILKASRERFNND